jgi:branched-chain amino acid transport system permease protein
VSTVTGTTSSPPATGFRVTRSNRNVAWTGAGALIVVVVLALFPYIVYSGTTSLLVQAFIVLTLACMWNLLAGYAGLVSVGQQAFVGLGAYFVLILAIHGTSPFAALPVAAIACGVAALPIWWLLSRLRSGYFAIATWVLAATIMLIIEKFSSIGGGTGMPLPGLGGLGPTLLTAYTYWAGLAVTVAALAGTPRSATTRWPRAVPARGSAWPGRWCSWWRGSAAAPRARCWPSASFRCSRARCSACSGPRKWASR